MSYYSVGIGHDVAEIDLDLIVPQPRSQGVQVARRSFGSSGVPTEEGNYIILIWDVINDIAAWNALLNQFDLGAALSADITVRVPNYQFGYTRWNGTAIRPKIGEDVQRSNFFIRNVRLLIRDMVYI